MEKIPEKQMFNVGDIVYHVTNLKQKLLIVDCGPFPDDEGDAVLYHYTVNWMTKRGIQRAVIFNGKHLTYLSEDL